jgi:electron transfer flavoprotein beta subunit
LVRRAIAYKLAATPLEYSALLDRYPEFETQEALDAYLEERNLKITLWTTADLDVDEDRLGLGGSPTKVLKVDYVVLQSMDTKEVDESPEGIADMVRELVAEYIL